MKKKIIILLVVLIGLALAGIFYFYFFKPEDKEIRPGTRNAVQNDTLYNKLIHNLSNLKSAHYTVKNNDGNFFEEKFNPESRIKIISDREEYFGNKWIVTINRKEKSFIAKERLEYETYPGSVIDWMKEWVPGSSPEVTGNNLIFDDRFRTKIALDNKGYPVKFFWDNDVLEIKYLSVNEPLEIELPKPPADYFTRILTQYDYALSDSETGNLIDFSWDNERFKEDESEVFLNYTGLINDTQTSVYLVLKNNKASADVYPADNDSANFTTLLTGEINGRNITLKNYFNDTLVFKGVYNKENLQGKWIFKNGEKENIKLSCAPYSVTIETIIDLADADSLKWAYAESEEYNTEYINYELYTHYDELLKFIPDCDRGNGFDILCNENGILSVTQSAYMYCEGDIKGSVYENFSVFDIIAGRQINERDMFVDDYKQILEEKGYYTDRTDALVLPNGILFQGHFSSIGPGSQLFLNWQQVLPVIKPFGPLHPFLLQHKLAEGQPQFPG